MPKYPGRMTFEELIEWMQMIRDTFIGVEAREFTVIFHGGAGIAMATCDPSGDPEPAIRTAYNALHPES